MTDLHVLGNCYLNYTRTFVGHSITNLPLSPPQSEQSAPTADIATSTPNLPRMFFTRSMSITTFLIGTSSLAFSGFVLYPWHHRLDDDFKELMADRKRKERERLEELTRIRAALERLEVMGKNRYDKGWHWL
jgi:hypothetical protein